LVNLTGQLIAALIFKQTKTTNHETKSAINRQENWKNISTSFQKQKIMQRIYE